MVDVLAYPEHTLIMRPTSELRELPSVEFQQVYAGTNVVHCISHFGVSNRPAPTVTPSSCLKWLEFCTFMTCHINLASNRVKEKVKVQKLMRLDVLVSLRGS